MLQTDYLSSLKNQLSERRERLQKAVKYVPDLSNLNHLLKQVDSALERIDDGSYGICDVCHEPIETDRLMTDPLISVCLDHLNGEQQHALELDLETAAKIQRGLLPQNNLKINGWEYGYHYNPAGPVSGDFFDLIPADDESFIFVFGDVSGKGISASLMVSHLHALTRSLITFGLPVNEIAERTNRLFCESAVSANYATMVFGKAGSNGDIELCIAGHNPPLLVQNGHVVPLNATGIPVGLFCESEYNMNNFTLGKNDYLLLYTDGLTESSVEDIEYGEERIKVQLRRIPDHTPQLLLDNLINDHKNFLGESKPKDDVTVAVIKKI